KGEALEIPHSPEKEPVSCLTDWHYTPMGRFFFHVMGALAEMERELIVERTKAGLEAARAQGRIGGRRPKLTPEQWAQAGRLIAAGIPRQKVAIIYDVGVSTLYKKFPVGDK
ncbi:recombinase family protein, partial [Escherichia coli]|uniref:recombinase family protein n=1 Tax=Escherichia coli TaxID=562 RepID=UPI002FE25E37